MAQTAKKVNFMVRNNIVKELEEWVSAGERSKVVNEALRKELIDIKRKKLTTKLLKIRGKNPSLSMKQIVIKP